MTEGIPLGTLAIAPQPDATTSFAEAFNVGRSLAHAGAAPLAAPPWRQGAGDATVGDVSQLAAQIDATSPAQRPSVIAQAQQSNEQVAHVLIGLKSFPPGQRLAIARHLAQTTGLLDPGGIGAVDVTDEGIDAHLAQAMSVEHFLKRESLYATIPAPIAAVAPSIQPGPDPRAGLTGAGHLTNAQLSTSLGL